MIRYYVSSSSACLPACRSVGRLLVRPSAVPAASSITSRNRTRRPAIQFVCNENCNNDDDVLVIECSHAYRSLMQYDSVPLFLPHGAQFYLYSNRAAPHAKWIWSRFYRHLWVALRVSVTLDQHTVLLRAGLPTDGVNTAAATNRWR